MPILICLKEPKLNLIVAGEIKDTKEAVKEWDELFQAVLIVKKQDGLNMLIPLLRDCNVAFMQEVTKKEIEEQREEAEKRRKKAEAQGGHSGLISKPEMLFPSGRGGRS